MRKWEQKYEEFSNSKELEEKMAILEDKINGKVAFKEEYEEFKQLNAVKENLPKVKNILQLRENLEKENEEINKEIKKRESRVELNRAVEKLDKELKVLEKEYSKIGSELKSGKLTEEEKMRKNLKLKEIESKKQKNNVEFGNYQDQLKIEAEEISKSKYKDISTDELKEQAYQGKMKISKCNLACNKLMQGYSWDSVEVALDKFEEQKFTAKGKEAEKMRKNRVAAKASNTKEQNKEAEQDKETEKDKVETKTKKQETVSKEENQSLAVQEEKTMFQKIKEMFKKLTNKAKNWIMGKEDFEDEVEEAINDEKEEKDEKESESKESLVSKLINKTKEWINGQKESENDAKEVSKDKEEAEIKEEKKAVEEKKEEAKESEQPQKDNFKEYLKFVAENGVNISPEEKAKEDEINKTIEMLVESRKQKAEKEGKTFDEESTRKTARAVAENSYKRKHQPTQQATQENNGQDR